MNQPSIQDIYKENLSDKDFNRLSSFIMNEYGIKMPPVKKVMLQSRLQKRLKSLNMSDFRTYVDYLFTPEGQKEEVIHMMDVVSTNKTDFFREHVHFNFLTDHVLPELLSNTDRRHLKVWSAGCSSGEEPYTIAIVLNEYGALRQGFSYSIFASDISTKVLNTGIEAIYKEDKIDAIPLYLKKKYFLRSKNREDKKVRIIPELRQKVTFRRLNLIERNYAIHDRFDIIFCRNVLIYFDRSTQEHILKKLCTYLNHRGFIFLGHSESISGFKLPLDQIQPTIYQLK